jgi:hypothetical protein
LRDEINRSLEIRGIKLCVPEEHSWTAVVQGAVLCGIEKDTTSRLSIASPCLRHYALAQSQKFSTIYHGQEDLGLDPITKMSVAVDQLDWLLNKNDLILSDEPTEVLRTYYVPFKKKTIKTDLKGTLQFYAFDNDDIPRPTKLLGSYDGRSNQTTLGVLPNANSVQVLLPAGSIDYDLSDQPWKLLEGKKSGFKDKYHEIAMLVKLVAEGESLRVSLHWNDQELGSVELNLL